jgi:predicted deacylase
MTADINGILNVLRETGILKGKICPFDIWHCGTVGDIKG